MSGPVNDPVERPLHYVSHPSGVECITVTEHMTFNLGNVFKYVWRAGMKGDVLENLRKARWYLQREIDRLSPPVPLAGREWPPGSPEAARAAEYRRDR